MKVSVAGKTVLPHQIKHMCMDPLFIVLLGGILLLLFLGFLLIRRTVLGFKSGYQNRD